MSYDVWVQDLPANLQSLEDIPDDFMPGVIGSRSEIISKIVEVAPFADFSDPAWGTIDGPDFWIEVNMSKEQVKDCHFILRGSDKAVGVVADIVQRLGLSALHSGGDGIFRPEAARAAFQSWRKYRDQIVSGAEQSAV